MADNQETVQYTFEGDTGPLADSTEEAISLLDRFANAIQSVAAVGATFRQAWAGFTDGLDTVRERIQSFRGNASQVFENVRAAMAQVSSAFRRTATETDNNNGSFRRLAGGISRLGAALRSMVSHTRQGTNSFLRMSRAGRGLHGVIRSLIGLRLGRWLAEAAKQSISFIENMNLFTVAMSDSLDVGVEFVEQMSRIYGMDPSNLMRYAGNFYQLADAIDMPDESAAKLSLSLVKATNDISSLFNVPIEDVFNDLSSGMQGMSRAVRKYGMDIRTTTLQQTALSLGITENISTMSEANRQGLRYITMMRQASNASGDFAKTIESPANQLKIFKEQMAVLGRTIGSIFIGPLTTAISYINGFIMALSTAISFVLAFFGILNSLFGSGNGFNSASSSADDVAYSVDGIGGAAGGAAKELKKMLAPFDELNVLQDQASSGGGGGSGLEDLGVLDPAIAAEIAAMELQLENVRMKATEVRDAILEFFGFQVEDGTILSWDGSQLAANLLSLVAVGPEWVMMFESLWHSISFVGQSIKTLWVEDLVPMFQSIGEALSPVLDTVVDLWEDLSNIITDVFDTVASVWGNTLQPVLSKFFDAVGSIAKIFGTLWSEIIGPVVRHIGDGLTTLWTTILRPIIEHALDLVGEIIEVILDLWNGALAPVVDWLAGVLAPIFVNVFNAVWDTVQGVVSGIGQSINGLLQILRGLLDFIAGAFTGDWSRAWQGVIDVFSGVWNTISGVVKSVMNGLIGILNGALGAISGAINSAIRAVNKISITIPSWIPGIGGKHFGFYIKEIGTWSIPYLASGGVVTSPTLAMVGEGKYDEAVIPLGNSPQMKELVNQIANATKSKGSDEPIQVNVYIGNEQIAEYTYRANKRAQLQTNGGI